MLSRHAEDLYWAGRYIERAEDTARMLDVTYHGLLESPDTGSEQAWRDLLTVLYLDATFPHEQVTAANVTRFLVLDDTNPGSIVSSVARARENTRGVRDRVSTEFWEAVNRLYLDLQGRDLERDLATQPYEVYRMVKTRCQTISGVAFETMPRDDGYRFQLLGRMLERAEMTCRMLSVRYSEPDEAKAARQFHEWVTVLKSVSAFEAYLKEHRAAVDADRVLEFLLVSADFPRSVLFCLRDAEEELDALVSAERRTAAQRLLGKARAKLEFFDVAEVVEEGLEPFLEGLQEEIWRVGDAIDAHFFKSGADLALHAYEAIT